jgi:hypothetical protein
METKFTGREAATIDRSAVDALLFGVTKGLDFLGSEKELLLDDMGRYMLEYLITVGRIKRTRRRAEFARSVQRLLVKNGFGGPLPLKFSYDTPTPTASHFVDYLAGTLTRPRGAASTAQVDWVLYEMMLYGMTRGLDFLGAQGQIMINRIGAEMLNYLIRIGKIEPTQDSDAQIERALSFFVKAGFAVKIEGKKPQGQASVIEFTYVRSRYHVNVLSRLRNEGSVLYSCPPCIIACSIKQKQGWKIRFDVGLEMLAGGEAVLRHTFYPDSESFTEQMASEVSRMMKA